MRGNTYGRRSIAFCGIGPISSEEKAKPLEGRALLEPDQADPEMLLLAKEVRTIARTFTTTLTATAIRFVDLCPEACAIVWSEASAIKWAITGSNFPFIRFGTALSSYSHAYDAFRGKSLPTGAHEVPAARVD